MKKKKKKGKVYQKAGKEEKKIQMPKLPLRY